MPKKFGAMKDLKNYMVEETLKNGLRVEIRAIRPDDKAAVCNAFKELDERTVYLRFFGPKRELSRQELTATTEVDFVRTVALVTCIRDGETEKIIGGGRYTVFSDAAAPRKAEVSFLVEEDYHGLGISSITLRHLVGIAREQGIAEFHAEVLQENRGMLTIFNRSGFPVKQDFSEGLVHVTLLLEED